MKRTIIFALLLIAKISSAQFELDEKYLRGMNAGVFTDMVDLEVNKTYVGVRLGYQLNVHCINVGYGVGLENTSQSITSQYLLFANYTIYPNGISNRLNLLFDADIILRQVFHTPYQHYTIGMGFLTNFSQKLFMNSKIGAGLSTRNFNEGLGGSVNFRIGIGFRF